MVGFKYRALKRFKSWAIVLTLILGIFISFPSLAWSRSGGFYGGTHVQIVKKPRQETIPKNGELFNYGDKHRKDFSFHVKNHRKNYQSLPPEEKARLKGKYRKWQSLPHERQKTLRHRMEKWKQLPPVERELFQQWFQQWQRLSPAEREMVREKLQKWDILPPGEQKKIRRKFHRPRGTRN